MTPRTGPQDRADGGPGHALAGTRLLFLVAFGGLMTHVARRRRDRSDPDVVALEDGAIRFP